MNRRHLLAGLALATVTLPPINAFAFTKSGFEKNAFEAAQSAGDPILLHVAAAWCETCQAQKAVLDKLEKDPTLSKYVIFWIDFDTEKDVMRSFGVRGRSTLIAFKGKAEVGRLVGDTREASIKALMAKGL
jgi:thioredoxin 1